MTRASLVLALGLAAPALAAQDSALVGRLDPNVLPAVSAVIDSARVAGLPTGPLVDKALEGTAKHADAERIVVAVRVLGRALKVARDALGPAATPDELAAGAGAIRAGIPPRTVAEVRAGRQGQPVTIPLAVMSELVARGLSPDSAAGLVLAKTSHGTNDAALVDLARETGTGAPPSLAATGPGGGSPAHGFYSVPASVNPGTSGPPTNHPPSSPHRP